MAVPDRRPEVEQLQGLLSLMSGSAALQQPLSVGGERPESPAHDHLEGGGAASRGSLPKPIRLGAIQPKLRISQQNDPAEREADRIADAVVRMPATSPLSLNYRTSTPGTLHLKCKACSHEQDENDGEQPTILHRQPIGTDFASTPVGGGLESPLPAGSAGHPLPVMTRNYFESRFGAEFGGVLIHTGFSASQSAKRINSRAYTYGDHIVFGAGEYRPETDDGKRLIAHELTHVLQQQGSRSLIQRQPTPKSSSEGKVAELLKGHSFAALWKRFSDCMDVIHRDMFMQRPVYSDLGDQSLRASQFSTGIRQEALSLVNDLLAHFENDSVDAFRYGMEFAKHLDFLGQKESASRARNFHQRGWVFMSFMHRPESGEIGVELQPHAPPTAIPSTLKSQPVKTGLTAVKPDATAPAATTGSMAPTLDTAPAEELRPAERQYVGDPGVHPLPYEGDLIVKLPKQTFLMAAKGKPYLIEGSIGKAMTNGRILFGYTNFVIVLDLESMGNKIEKYYVSPLVSQGSVYKPDAQFKTSDFTSFIESDSGSPPRIPVLFNRLDRTRNLKIMAVILQDTDITPSDVSDFVATRQMVAAVKKDFTASPELASAAFGKVDQLIAEGEVQDAADRLGALTEAAFALLPLSKKIEYIELLTDAWTWEAQEKAIVEVMKSVDTLDELKSIKKVLQAKKTWDGGTKWDKMFSDLNHECFSLLVAVGMKFDSDTYTLSEFKSLFWEMIRNVSVVGVFINSNGEPEVIPEALKNIELAVRGAVDFLEGIWDGIAMFVSHPDKIVEGVGQMLNLILNLQLVQLGYPPALDYVKKVFGQVSKQLIAATRGLALLEAEDLVIKKVKWAIIWEVASWFVGVGEIKAAMKGVQISGLTEKVASVSRVLSRAAGLGRVTIKEAELVSRLDRLVTVLMRESKLLKSEEETLALLSKLSNDELAKVLTAIQKSEIQEGSSLLALAKETPELEDLARKLEVMERLAKVDQKILTTEKEIGQMQRLVNDESDPLFQKLLNKEEQVFNEKVKQPGTVLDVIEKDLREAYDVEVKIGDHTYRRNRLDGSWCRFTTRRCNFKLDNGPVNKQKPLQLPPPKLSEIDAGSFAKTQFPAADWEMHPLFQGGQRVTKKGGRNPLLSSEPEWYSQSLNAAVEVKRKDFIATLQSVDWSAMTRQLEQRIHALPKNTQNWMVFDIRRQGEPIKLAEAISTKLSARWDRIFFLADGGTLEIVAGKAVRLP